MNLQSITRRIHGFVLGLGSGRECPFCGWTGFQFLPRTNLRKPSADAFCPKCNSAERHRFAYFVLKDRLQNVDTILHFAPEAAVTAWLRAEAKAYVSCDIEPGRAMEVQDIMRLTYADNSFSFIWCSNVLEHIPDDDAAMRELHRVLKHGGLCAVQVPIWREASFEDPTVQTPADRLKVFGQTDHVRLYGFDIVDRLSRAGFAVETVTTRIFDPAIVGRYGLDYLTTGEMFLCTKPG